MLPRRGALSLADLSAYRSLERTPLCTDWTARYRVCGMPPPSSGHLAMMQILGMLQSAPPLAPPLVDGVPGAAWLHTYTEAARLAFADRALYVADPAFVDAARRATGPACSHRPTCSQRAALIGPRAMDAAPAGQPGAMRAGAGAAAGAGRIGHQPDQHRRCARPGA